MRAIIQAGSRIHISLADMGFATSRAYGGLGFMIDHAAARLEIAESDFVQVVDSTQRLDADALNELKALWRHLTSLGRIQATVTVHDCGEQHVGLGVKTALKLAAIAGYRAIADLPLTRPEMQALSSRGGASGIGIHGFFEGGVIWDVGRPASEVTALMPSRGQVPLTLPLLMLRVEFPAEWKVALCLPQAPRSFGSDERTFFRNVLPLEKEDTREAMSTMYHEILPAIKTADLSALRFALRKLQNVGFKRLEIDRCGDAVRELLNDLDGIDVAAGMSSMGPLVYGIIHGNDLTTIASILEICKRRDAPVLGVVPGLNRGAILSVESIQ